MGEPARDERSLNLHQATGIERNHGSRAGALDGLDLGARHGAGKLGELHRKGAAEAAALLGRQHFAQFQAAHVRQQAARRVLHAEFAQGVAAIVKRDHGIQPRAHVFHAGHLGEERGEFPDALLECVYARQGLRLFGEQLGEMVDHHGGAGPRRHDDRFARSRTS